MTEGTLGGGGLWQVPQGGWGQRGKWCPAGCEPRAAGTMVKGRGDKIRRDQTVALSC